MHRFPFTAKSGFFVVGFFDFFVSRQIVFSMVFGGPGGFKKLREASRTNFHLISCQLDLMVPSYDQKTKKVGY